MEITALSVQLKSEISTNDLFLLSFQKVSVVNLKILKLRFVPVCFTGFGFHIQSRLLKKQNQNNNKKIKAQTTFCNSVAGWKRDEPWMGNILGILLWPQICKMIYYSTSWRQDPAAFVMRDLHSSWPGTQRIEALILILVSISWVTSNKNTEGAQFSRGNLNVFV